MTHLRCLLLLIALAAPGHACVFSYTWVPPWASLATWLCLLLAVFSVSGRAALLFLAISSSLLFFRLSNLLPLFGLFGFWLGCRLTMNNATSWTLLGRILLLPTLSYVGVVAGLWAWGVPTSITQSCTVCPSNLRNLSTAIEIYATDHQGAFPTALNQLVPQYINKLPQCIDGEAVSPEGRVFFRLRGFELAEGYGYRLVNPKCYAIWCRNRGYADHTGRLQPWYENSSGRHCDREEWIIMDGPSLLTQLAKGPPDPLVLKQRVINE